MSLRQTPHQHRCLAQTSSQLLFPLSPCLIPCVHSLRLSFFHQGGTLQRDQAGSRGSWDLALLFCDGGIGREGSWEGTKPELSTLALALCGLACSILSTLALCPDAHMGISAVSLPYVAVYTVSMSLQGQLPPSPAEGAPESQGELTWKQGGKAGRNRLSLLPRCSMGPPPSPQG